PLGGGTMHNKVVYRIAKAFHEAGFAALRFNFRGAGLSQGEHDSGRGEQDDLRAAIKFMNERYADAEVWLAGFSFGSAVMLRAGCADPSIRALIAAGAPVSKYDFSEVTRCDKPKLFIQGELDEFGNVADLKRVVARLSGANTLKVIEGAGHFFEGHLAELERAVFEFVNSINDELA
ncbi:MAG TPA: alpha/beta fold hydrolase, partial [Blastocatellia bacterium]